MEICYKRFCQLETPFAGKKNMQQYEFSNEFMNTCNIFGVHS